MVPFRHDTSLHAILSRRGRHDPRLDQKARAALRATNYTLALDALKGLSKSHSLKCVDFLLEMSAVWPITERLTSIALDACAKSGQIDAGRTKLFEPLKESGQVTACTYSILVKGYGRVADATRSPTERDKIADSIKGLVNDMEVSNVKPDLIFTNSLIDAYVRCGRVGWAEDKLKEMEYPDVWSYSSVLKGLARKGDVRRAVSLIRRMEDGGVDRNAHVVSSLAHALAVAGRPRLAERVLLEGGTTQGFTAVLKAHAEKRNAVPAFRLVKRMRQQRVARNEVTFTELLRACHGDPKLLDFAWTMMMQERVKPSPITYNVAIAGYLAAPELRDRDLQRALDLVKVMLSKDMMGVDTLNIVLEALLKIRKMEGWALKLLTRAVEDDSFPSPSTNTYSIVLRFFGRTGDLRRVQSTWAAIKQPDVVACNTYIDALARCNQLKDALLFLDEMPGKGITPTLLSYAPLILALTRSPNVYAGVKALQLYREMRKLKIKPDPACVRSTLMACMTLRERQSWLDDVDPVLKAVKEVLSGLEDYMPKEELDALKLFAKTTVLGESTSEVWKEDPKNPVWSKHKDWNAFDSGFRLI